MQDTNTPPEVKIPTSKLRSSCDGCGNAKVKCDRESPKCARCTSLSLPCVYGPSRKHGKPPRRKFAPATQSTGAKRQCSSGSNHHGPSLFIEHENRRHHSEYRSQIIPNVTSSLSQLTGSGFTELGVPHQDQLISNFYPSLASEEWLQNDDWSQFQHFGGGLDLFLDTPLEPTSIPRDTSKSSESHSCPRESYEIFRDLICPSPFLHAPEPNSVTVSAQLDQVLQFNKDAIERLTRVLRCPCAKTGHRAMVHASIVSRILIWYQQAAGWTGSSSWGPAPASSAETSNSPPPSRQPSSAMVTGADTTTEPSLVQATGFDVQHVPISMGAFSIENQNVQGAFRNQLVLSELKETANLIDIFMSQESDESSALYLHLGTWLRAEHSKTVNILRGRLRTLSASLNS